MAIPRISAVSAPRAGRRLVQGLVVRLRHHRPAILALVVRGLAVLAAFGVTFILGNRYGPAATGAYALVTQTAMFLAVAGLVGLDISVVRHFSKAVAKAMPVALRSLLQVLGLGFGMLGVIAATLWLGGDMVWQSLFGDVAGRELLLVLCVLLVGRGGAQLLGGLLRSQHRFTLGQAIAALTVPGWTAIALATGIATTVEDALWAAAYAALASVAIGTLAMLRHVSRNEQAVTIPFKAVVLSSLPLWGVGITLNIGDWYGLVISGQMLGAEATGLYRVAMQVAALLQIVSTTIFSVYSAQISAAFHADDSQMAARLAHSAFRVSIIAAVPLAIAILGGGKFLLAQIGPEFIDAMPLLIILTIGQFAYAVFGPPGMVLAMSGHEKINLAITTGGTALMLVVAPLGAWVGGAQGLVAGIILVMLTRNIVAYAIVRNTMGISIWAGTARADVIPKLDERDSSDFG